MKQVIQRWFGIGLMAASVLTIGGTLTLHSSLHLTSSLRQQVAGTPTAIHMEPKILMADGGGDAPIKCPLKGKCWGGNATI